MFASKKSARTSSAKPEVCARLQAALALAVDGDGPSQVLCGGSGREAVPFSSEVCAVSSVGTFSLPLTCCPWVFPRVYAVVSVQISPVKSPIPTHPSHSCDIVQISFSDLSGIPFLFICSCATSPSFNKGRKMTTLHLATVAA